MVWVFSVLNIIGLVSMIWCRLIKFTDTSNDIIAYVDFWQAFAKFVSLEMCLK